MYLFSVYLVDHEVWKSYIQQNETLGGIKKGKRGDVAMMSQGIEWAGQEWIN